MAEQCEDAAAQALRTAADMDLPDVPFGVATSLALLDVWLQGSRLDGLQLLQEIKRRDASLHAVRAVPGLRDREREQRATPVARQRPLVDQVEDALGIVRNGVARVDIYSQGAHGEPFVLGTGEAVTSGAETSLSAGSFAFMAAGMRHFVRTKGETVVQLHGTGPWGVTYVNPSEDPRRQ